MNISIFVMYSPDRLATFQDSLACLRQMDGYEEVDKILLCDDRQNLEIPGWRHSIVSREDGEFVWANMWAEGVRLAQYDNVLYLDSDRVLPRNYLGLLLDQIQDRCHLYCRNMFAFKRRVPVDVIQDYRDTFISEYLMRNYDMHNDLLVYDPRFGIPCDGPGKGVMSGNVAFTKRTYYESGGVDPFYRGHGAWADNDYAKQCHELGMKTIDLGCLELHLYHTKIDDSNTLSVPDIEILSLRNYIRYCVKWKISFDRVYSIIDRRGLSREFLQEEISKHGDLLD